MSEQWQPIEECKDVEENCVLGLWEDGTWVRWWGIPGQVVDGNATHYLPNTDPPELPRTYTEAEVLKISQRAAQLGNCRIDSSYSQDAKDALAEFKAKEEK